MEKASTRLQEIISECIMTRGHTGKFSKLLEILDKQAINYFNLVLQ